MRQAVTISDHVARITQATRTKKRMATQTKRTRFPGITADARELGVNRVTLYKMLAGYPGFAELKTLRKRYTTLKRRQTLSQRRSAA
jgi:DNA-binding phage protein